MAGGPHLTQAGMTIGSWAYMAPERVSGDDATKSVDIYSLACVLYETLIGARLFAIDSMQQAVNAHLDRELPSRTRAPATLTSAREIRCWSE
jgi:serine/threonine kinase PknH